MGWTRLTCLYKQGLGLLRMDDVEITHAQTPVSGGWALVGEVELTPVCP